MAQPLAVKQLRVRLKKQVKMDPKHIWLVNFLMLFLWVIISHLLQCSQGIFPFRGLGLVVSQWNIYKFVPMSPSPVSRTSPRAPNAPAQVSKVTALATPHPHMVVRRTCRQLYCTVIGQLAGNSQGLQLLALKTVAKSACVCNQEYSKLSIFASSRYCLVLSQFIEI